MPVSCYRHLTTKKKIDITQNAKPEFDTAVQVIKGGQSRARVLCSGEHDFALDDGEQYKQRFAKASWNASWE
jgi:hypothetical protein